jgi:hypothetical protein
MFSTIMTFYICYSKQSKNQIQNESIGLNKSIDKRFTRKNRVFCVK